MYHVDSEIDFGIVERRFYDDKDRLTEIRKMYPAMHHATGIANRPSSPWSGKGD